MGVSAVGRLAATPRSTGGSSTRAAVPVETSVRLPTPSPWEDSRNLHSRWDFWHGPQTGRDSSHFTRRCRHVMLSKSLLAVDVLAVVGVKALPASFGPQASCSGRT